MHLIHNEKLKLTSLNLNLVGAGSTLAGIVLFVMQFMDRADMKPRETVAALLFIGIGIALHGAGRLLLDRLREEP